MSAAKKFAQVVLEAIAHYAKEDHRSRIKRGIQAARRRKHR